MTHHAGKSHPRLVLGWLLVPAIEYLIPIISKFDITESLGCAV